MATRSGSKQQPIRLPATRSGDAWQLFVYAHTHWDREWYRSFERFRMQLVGVIDRLLETLDRDPAFATFVLDGQAIVLEDYLAIRPEELPRVRRLAGAGRLEVGPWYVLPDEFLVSGEALVRNLLEGSRSIATIGTPTRVGYLPDPFGHVAQLPAILRGFGIDNVVFSRGMGDELERTGSEFRWESPSGTDVLAFVQGSPYTSGYCNAELFVRGASATDEVGYDHLRELLPHLASAARLDGMLLAAGCDHETVQADLPEIVERIASLVPDATVRFTGLGEAVEAARAAERRRDADGFPLERHRGELRGSRERPILSSIFSARIDLKRDNDRLQSLLQAHVEPLVATAALAGVRPNRDVEPFLRHAWRLVLQNQPHDSIGGCSIDAVHREMVGRSLRADAVANGLLEDLRVALQCGDRAVVHDARGMGGIVERADGTPVAVGLATPGRLVDLADVVRDEGVEVDGDSVRAGELTARVAGVEPGAGGPWLEVGGMGATTILDWIDEADAGDEYDFGAVDGDQPLVARIDRWSTRQAGPGVAELEVVHVLELPVALAPGRDARAAEVARHEITTLVRLARTSDLAHLSVSLDNQAFDHRLRLRACTLDVADATSPVEALGHFAIIERPARPAATSVPWRQQPPGLDHCAGAVRLTPHSATGAGAPVLLAGRGIHEYEVRAFGNSHALELTVLRCVGWLSRDDVVGRPGHAGPGIATPDAQCLGPVRRELAVGVASGASFDRALAFLDGPLLLEPFGVGQSQDPGDARDGAAVCESGALARARDVLGATPSDARARIDQLGLEVDGTGVVQSACKLAEDGSGDLVVRWWCPAGGADGRASLRLGVPVRDAWRARLDETTLGPAPWQDDRCELRVPAGGITTLRVAIDR